MERWWFLTGRCWFVVKGDVFLVEKCCSGKGWELHPKTTTSECPSRPRLRREETSMGFDRKTVWDTDHETTTKGVRDLMPIFRHAARWYFDLKPSCSSVSSANAVFHPKSRWFWFERVETKLLNFQQAMNWIQVLLHKTEWTPHQ